MPRSSQARSPIVGVLALQGDYASHAHALEDIGVESRMVRAKECLAHVDGLIIPGGESTTFLKLLEREGLFQPLLNFTQTRPTFGTCAGCILLAAKVLRPEQQSLAVLDATVERNAYGRQIDSDILSVETSLPGGPLEMVFIRAPRIMQVGNRVDVLAARDGLPVLVRQQNILAATFHPELSHSDDRRVHRYFLQMVEDWMNSAAKSTAGDFSAARSVSSAKTSPADTR